MGYSDNPKYLPLHVYLFTGTIASIPAGMQLCNGSNGTVDLRNRFVVCADADSGGVAKSTVTGSALQTSDGQLIAHTHGITIGESDGNPGSYVDGSDVALSSIVTGSTGSGTKNVAVFYALAFIQRIGG